MPNSILGEYLENNERVQNAFFQTLEILSGISEEFAQYKNRIRDMKEEMDKIKTEVTALHQFSVNIYKILKSKEIIGEVNNNNIDIDAGRRRFSTIYLEQDID
jgi:hypothetical protein